MADEVEVGGIKIVGIGRARGVPDVAHVGFAAESMDLSVQVAMENAGAALTRMRDALVEGGISEVDLRTGHTSVSTSYGRHEQPRGFQAHLGLSATVRDVEMVGEVLARTLNAGGDAARLHEVRFSQSDPSRLLVAARQNAFDDAMAKAQQYAELAGQSLGAIVEITEAADGPAFVRELDEGIGFAAAASMPIEPGADEVTVSVTVRWAWLGR